MRKMSAVLFVVGLGFFAYRMPLALEKAEATSFVKFAEGGVTIDVVPGSAMAGSGDVILVPSGMSLMMGATFEFKNSKGETRYADFCNGHPDYWRLVEAEPRLDRVGKRVRFELTESDLSDPHTESAWWVSHMGFERRLRMVEPK